MFIGYAGALDNLSQPGINEGHYVRKIVKIT